MSTTTTVPAGLAGLTIDHARRLARESRRGKRQVEAISLRGGKFKQRVIVGMVKALFTSKMAEFIDRLTLGLTDQSVWFHGLRTGIEDGSTKLDADNTALLAAIVEAQEAVTDLRMTMVEVQGNAAKIIRKVDGPAMHSLQLLLSSLSDVFDALEGARWAVLEREADEDIAAGRVSKTFTSAAELIASLRA